MYAIYSARGYDEIESLDDKSTIQEMYENVDTLIVKRCLTLVTAMKSQKANAENLAKAPLYNKQ